jgi:hypothetical protein
VSLGHYETNTLTLYDAGGDLMTTDGVCVPVNPPGHQIEFPILAKNGTKAFLVSGEEYRGKSQ